MAASATNATRIPATTTARRPPSADAPARTPWTADVRAALDTLERVLAGFDPQRCDGDAALELLALFARARKAAAAGEALTAGRVEQCRAHERGGHRSAAHLVAELSGTTLGRAGEIVETGRLVRDVSATGDRLRAGELSVDQAHVVADAAQVAPDREAELLELAGRESVRSLAERARDVRLEADDDRLGRHRRQHTARMLSHGRDREGMVWGRFRLPPEVGAAVVNRLERQADREFRAKPREQRHREGHHHHLADALVTLTTGARPDATATNPTNDRRADVVVHVSYEALRRGHLESGERCTVQGVGPIPLAVARDVMRDAFLKAVLVDGTEIVKVAHLGRRRPAELQTALEARAVVRDGDVVCSAPGCDQRLGIEWDHVQPHAVGGATSYENLRPVCRHHHRTRPRGDP